MIGYEEIYSRNIGLFTIEEQQRLREAVVAVAGVGGVGGYQAVAIARQGVGELRIMDPGVFDEPDLNRQYGAMMSTLGENKALATEKMLRDMNPYAKIKTYIYAAESRDEVQKFIRDADIVIDAIDYAGFGYKQMLHACARENGQYVFSSPIPGFGATLMIFSPEGMTMEEFYMAPDDPALYNDFRLAMRLMMPHDVFPPVYRDFEEGRVGYLATNGAAAQLSGAITGMEAAFIITGRRKKEEIIAVPKIIYVDLFHRKYSVFNPHKGE